MGDCIWARVAYVYLQTYKNKKTKEREKENGGRVEGEVREGVVESFGMTIPGK